MSDFDSDTYTLRWPPGLFRREVEHLIHYGRKNGIDQDWVGEVEFLRRATYHEEPF